MEVKVVLCFLLIFVASSQTQAGSSCFFDQFMYHEHLFVLLAVVLFNFFTFFLTSYCLGVNTAKITVNVWGKWLVLMFKNSGKIEFLKSL